MLKSVHSSDYVPYSCGECQQILAQNHLSQFLANIFCASFDQFLRCFRWESITIVSIIGRGHALQK